MSDHSLAVLTLSPSNTAPDRPYTRPIERRIGRSALLDVAPDRESLLISNKGIEELRRILKVQVGHSTGSWLYHRHHTNTTQLSSTARASPFLEGTTDSIDTSTTSGPHHASAPSISPLSKSSAMFSFQNASFAVRDKSLSLDTWDMPLLSTKDTLISPRPLGPTHILLIYEASAMWMPANPNGTITLRSTKSHCPKFVELPINDLLFLLNVPNLSSRQCVPALPRRLDKELPRVVMQVPHLETFPELVIYLHTMNQAELFRALIPEWIRDLMHPLPSLAGDPGDMVERRGRRCQPMRLLARLACGFNPNSSYHEIRRNSPQPKRTLNSISKEIAKASGLSVDGDHIDPVLHAASLMDALRDNLDYIGYYGEELWNELGSCRAILIRALSWKAKIDEKDQ